MSIKIGLDAGHGLKTAGKQTPTGIKEWTLNDAVADKVAKYLADYDCTILRTDNNEGNKDESLSVRLNKYINAKVDSFVSIHHNALKTIWSTATGVEVYVDRNATIADKYLAECIYTRLVKYTGLKGRGIKTANFAVINQNKIPAVLVEGGFMDGKKDYKYITSEAGQDAYARAVAEGIIAFHKLTKKEKPKAESKPATKTETKPATIRVGSTVKVKSGAKTYDGGKLASFVYKRNHIVKQIKGQRVVITYNGEVVAAVKLSDLTLIK